MSNLKKNYFYNVLYQLLIMILPLFTAPYVSRIIGAEGIGIFSYTQSIANYFLIFAMLGVMNYGNRMIAAVREDKSKLSEMFWNIYILQLFFSIAAIIFYLMYIIFFQKDYITVSIIQSLYVISAAFDINWFFFGLEEFKLTTIRNVIIKIITVGLIFIFVNDSNDLTIYTFIMGFGMLLSTLIMWKFLFMRVHLVRPKFQIVLSHLKPNFILFIPVLSISLYKIMDKIMLGSLSTVTEVGYYVNAEKIVAIPLGLTVALGSVMLPRMSNLVAKGETKKSKEYIDKSMYFIIFLSFALIFGIAGIAPEFIPLFFGPEFLPTTNIVILLAPTILFLSWANVIRTQYLIPNKKDKIYIYSVIIGAIVNLSFNFVFILMFGALGAAIGTIGAELSVAIFQTLAVRDELKIKSYVLNGVPFFLIGVIMYLVVRIVSLFGVNYILLVFLEVILGALTYIMLSILYFLLSKNPLLTDLQIKVYSRLYKLINSIKIKE